MPHIVFLLIALGIGFGLVAAAREMAARQPRPSSP